MGEGVDGARRRPVVRKRAVTFVAFLVAVGVGYGLGAALLAGGLVLVVSGVRALRGAQEQRPGVRGARRAFLVIAVGMVLVLVGALLDGAEPLLRSDDPADGADTAWALLHSLEVKGRAPRTGYDRARFGQAWADVDRNGCDTRNDILRRDLTDVTVRGGPDGCRVLEGVLADPYGPSTIDFQQGPDTSSQVQIDHVVALSDAWAKGAQQLDEATRTAFANDPVNLLAVDGPLNQQKGDGDAATWLPPNEGFRCEYVARQVSVKAAYGLWVTPAERDAMSEVLQTCPDQSVFTGTLR